MLGQQVAAGKITNGQLNVGQIAAGSYILEVISSEQVIVKRFIRN